MDAELMTPSERIAKIRELLTEATTANSIVFICESVSEALSLLDGIETEGAIVKAAKEGKVGISATETRAYMKWRKDAWQVYTTKNIFEVGEETAALAALLGEEPPQ